MTRTIEVSAAILLRETDGASEYLLAQRPPDKVYAGYWEFPGGKLEAGESFRDALVRELHEELGIEIEQAAPWLCREFTYPHARVRLKFFRVTNWRGDIHPHEHTGIVWTRLGETPTVTPVLPANGPILRALALPVAYAITHAAGNGIDAELERIRRALQQGTRLFQLRDKTLSPDERRSFAKAVMALAGRYPDACILVNDDARLASDIGASGVHLSSGTLGTLEQRPDFAWVAASCHTVHDLQRAEALGIDFAVLSPVLKTASHPEAEGMGWGAFGSMVERSTIPVFALGGMRPELLGTAQAHGAHGIALMRGW